MISPHISILTRDELKAREDSAFQSGVKRGKLEAHSRAASAIELLEQGASLFFGRNPDMSHMDTEDFREAHRRWFTRVSDFLKEPRP